ncbi:MAG: hypothetical protein ACQEP1_06400 [Nanobdellota archaeon]
MMEKNDIAYLMDWNVVDNKGNKSSAGERPGYMILPEAIRSMLEKTTGKEFELIEKEEIGKSFEIKNGEESYLLRREPVKPLPGTSENRDFMMYNGFIEGKNLDSLTGEFRGAVIFRNSGKYHLGYGR